MARSHPPTLLRLAERTLREEIGLAPGARVLVAVSGGPDSIALVHVLWRLAAPLGLRVETCGVDHGLRKEAPEELQLARSLAEQLSIPFTHVALTVSKGADLQQRARTARRQALVETAAARGCGFIATGHHADDRAETVLLRLLRGSGPRGLAVLPARDGVWLRPLIRARRMDIRQHLTRHSLAFAIDPSNDDPRFARTRVRREVLPLLESLSPGVTDHLNALADQLAADPPPDLLDQNGLQIPLGRAQSAQIQRALETGRTCQVRLKGGKVLHIHGRSGVFTLQHSPDDPPRILRRGLEPPTYPGAGDVNFDEFPGTSGGAKPDKSG